MIKLKIKIIKIYLKIQILITVKKVIKKKILIIHKINKANLILNNR